MRIRSILLGITAACLAFALSACALTSAQQSGLDGLATAAVAVEVQQGSSNPAVWTARAQKIKAIATELQAVNAATQQSLPAVLAALQPIIAASGLAPADILIGNALISEFSTLLNNQLGSNPTAAQVQTSVSGVLTAIIAACSVYAPPTATS